MSTKLYCNVYTRAFDVVPLGCGQQESGSSYMTMRGRIRHYPSKNFCQYVKLDHCTSHAPYSQDLSPCYLFYSHAWNEHWNAMAKLTFGPFRWTWHNRSETYHKKLSRTASDSFRNAWSRVLMKEEVISKNILSTRVHVNHTHFYTCSLRTFWA